MVKSYLVVPCMLAIGLVGCSSNTPPAQNPASPKAGQADPAKNSDTDLLQGAWTPVATEENGKREDAENPPELKEKSAWTFEGSAIRGYAGGETFEATYTLGSKNGQKTIDILITDGTDKGRRQQALYEISGDVLRLCMYPDKRAEMEVPAEFASQGDAGIIIFNR